MVNMKISKIMWIFILETINALSWFLMDICWMNDFINLSTIFGSILLITGIIPLFIRTISFDRIALFFWMYMNFLWMRDSVDNANICAIIGGAFIALSLLTKHNIINFKRGQNK